MQELKRWSKEFNSLAQAVHLASKGLEPIYKNRYDLVLYDSIKHIEPVRTLELSDIKQELRMFWFLFVNKWHETQPEITLRQYILRRSLWALRDWYTWAMKPNGYSHERSPVNVTPTFPFELDIDFLILGSDIYPFSLLTSYQRYILYLKYKQELSNNEIAHTVIKTKKTIGLEVNKIIRFLRSQVQCEQKTKVIS